MATFTYRYCTCVSLLAKFNSRMGQEDAVAEIGSGQYVGQYMYGRRATFLSSSDARFRRFVEFNGD